MTKILFPFTFFILLLQSCNNKNLITGKWHMAHNEGITINFIDDSTCLIESINAAEKIRKMKYEIENDTILELNAIHLFPPRKWKIIKLNKDSLVINSGRITARYYR